MEVDRGEATHRHTSGVVGSPFIQAEVLSLVKVAFVFTALSHQYLIHELQASIQMASLPARSHSAECAPYCRYPKH